MQKKHKPNEYYFTSLTGADMQQGQSRVAYLCQILFLILKGALLLLVTNFIQRHRYAGHKSWLHICASKGYCLRLHPTAYKQKQALSQFAICFQPIPKGCYYYSLNHLIFTKPRRGEIIFMSSLRDY